MTIETPAAGPEPRLETLRPLLRATLALLGVLALLDWLRLATTPKQRLSDWLQAGAAATATLALLDLALRSRDLARAFWGSLAIATLTWTVGQVWWTIELGALTAPYGGAAAPTAISLLFHATVRACEPPATTRGVRLELERAEPLPEVELDQRRLARAFQNLIENALHFTPAGGLVQVRIASAPDGRVLYEVRDEGPSLDYADAPRVFEPFPTKRRGGTGLGLSMVQRIVREHGGSVSLENHAERGAVARVWLSATPSSRAGVPGTER